MKRPIHLFVGSILVGLSANVFAITSERCIDYFSVGQSGCDNRRGVVEAEPPTPQPTLSSPTVVIPPQPQLPTLDQRIDEYLDNYDKPPREFVAFQLEPTPENALAWVHKYQSMIQRTQDISTAWQQASLLYDQLEQTGELPTFEDNLPPVPSNLFNPAAAAENNQQFTRRNQVAASGLLTAQLPAAQLTFYYERDCADCAAAAAQIQQLLQQWQGQAELLCVDISGGVLLADPGLPCQRRAILPGEREQFNVNAVPLLMLQAGLSGELARIPGGEITVATGLAVLEGLYR